MSDEEEECNCPPEGLPAWMGTFADLMSLLMCFFVLLLAFSEMDVLKFKQLAGSMRFAFGVQNKVEVKDIPKGTSVIAQEFSPGKPDPTPVETVMQHTQEITQDVLEFTEEEEEIEGAGDLTDKGDGEEKNTAFYTELGSLEIQEMNLEQLQAQLDAAEELAKGIAEQIAEEIGKGQLEVETVGRVVIIRIKEKGSFTSGSDRIRAGFRPIIAKLREILKNTEGRFFVVGHTDNLPIETERFRSNWELSSARAVSVVHELLRTKELDPSRFEVSGVADTQPLEDNATAKGRSQNRRVEIRIVRGNTTDGSELSVTPPPDTAPTN
ncbi:MAG: flagellar motor protein MotB [Pseudomonadota bacterium]